VPTFPGVHEVILNLNRRGGAFLFLVFSPAFLVFSFSFLFLFFFFSFSFLLLSKKRKAKKRQEKTKKSEEKTKKRQEKTRKDKKRQEIGGSVNLINLRNYPGNTFIDVISMCNADSGLVLV